MFIISQSPCRFFLFIKLSYNIAGDYMYHIKERVVSFVEAKKSKFYCILMPIDDEKKVKEEIAALKKEYPAASHYCYGLVIKDVVRSNDDGEPATTAGKPILEVLKNKDLDNVLAVVIRYFGGTLLGTAGLVKAYSQATIEACKLATLTTPTLVYTYALKVDYSLTSKIEYFLKNNATIVDREYDDSVTYIYQSLVDLSEQIRQLTSGKFLPELIESQIEEFPVNS